MISDPFETALFSKVPAMDTINDILRFNLLILFFTPISYCLPANGFGYTLLIWQRSEVYFFEQHIIIKDKNFAAGNI